MRKLRLRGLQELPQGHKGPPWGQHLWVFRCLCKYNSPTHSSGQALPGGVRESPQQVLIFELRAEGRLKRTKTSDPSRGRNEMLKQDI
jgi:hypothetical protein